MRPPADVVVGGPGLPGGLGGVLDRALGGGERAGGGAAVAVQGGGVGQRRLVVGHRAGVLDAACVVDALLGQAHGGGAVAQVDGLHRHAPQGGGGQLRVAGLGRQTEGVRVVLLGEALVALVTSHPPGQVHQLRGRREQLAAGGLGVVAVQPGGDVLRQIAHGQVAGVSPTQLGGGVTKGGGHLPDRHDLTAPDIDRGPGSGGAGAAGDRFQVGQG